jgi:hypothetical protein
MKLAFDSLSNARDLGGYVNMQGRKVKTGYIYRSATVAGASIADIEKLVELQVKLIIDLRTEEEVQEVYMPEYIAQNFKIEETNWMIEEQDQSMLKLCPLITKKDSIKYLFGQLPLLEKIQSCNDDF